MRGNNMQKYSVKGERINGVGFSVGLNVERH